jgi:hypothetical protein
MGLLSLPLSSSQSLLFAEAASLSFVLVSFLFVWAFPRLSSFMQRFVPAKYAGLSSCAIIGCAMAALVERLVSTLLDQQCVQWYKNFYLFLMHSLDFRNLLGRVYGLDVLFFLFSFLNSDSFRLVEFLLVREIRIMIAVFWVAAIGGYLSVLPYLSSSNLSLYLVRKYFHALAIVLFTPALLFDASILVPFLLFFFFMFLFYFFFCSHLSFAE